MAAVQWLERLEQLELVLVQVLESQLALVLELEQLGLVRQVPEPELGLELGLALVLEPVLVLRAQLPERQA